MIGALAGCMSDDGDGARPHVAGPGIGEPIQLVACRDWQRARVRERHGTVRQLREFAGGPTGSPGGRGTTLDDREAYELFERTCRQKFARGFKLYKLYTRAAAFSQ